MGFDVNVQMVKKINKGLSPIKHIPHKQMRDMVRSKRFRATDSMRELSKPDALLICVPTPLSNSRDPDLSFVESTALMIAAQLRPGQLVVLESTTYPGTTRDVLLPILSESGLRPGVDFFLAYSP